MRVASIADPFHSIAASEGSRDLRLVSHMQPLDRVRDYMRPIGRAAQAMGTPDPSQRRQQMATTTTDHHHTTDRRISTETKSSYKTTELIAYVVAVVGVLVASAMADEASDFGPQEAWFYVSLLTIGYMISRGLAKSGSRDYYDDETNNTRR